MVYWAVGQGSSPNAVDMARIDSIRRRIDVHVVIGAKTNNLYEAVITRIAPVKQGYRKLANTRDEISALIENRSLVILMDRSYKLALGAPAGHPRFPPIWEGGLSRACRSARPQEKFSLDDFFVAPSSAP